MNAIAQFANKIDDAFRHAGQPLPIELEHVRRNLIAMASSINRVPMHGMAKQIAFEALVPIAAQVASEFQHRPKAASTA